jgi:phenolic acid decarboxylase
VKVHLSWFRPFSAQTAFGRIVFGPFEYLAQTAKISYSAQRNTTLGNVWNRNIGFKPDCSLVRGRLYYGRWCIQQSINIRMYNNHSFTIIQSVRQSANRIAASLSTSVKKSIYLQWSPNERECVKDPSRFTQPQKAFSNNTGNNNKHVA